MKKRLDKKIQKFVDKLNIRIVYSAEEAKAIDDSLTALDIHCNIAFYNTVNDFIYVSEERNGTSKEACLIHEAVHWTGAENRLNRFNDFFRPRYYDEFVACVVSYYIANYFKHDDLFEEVTRVLKLVCRECFSSYNGNLIDKDCYEAIDYLNNLTGEKIEYSDDWKKYLDNQGE